MRMTYLKEVLSKDDVNNIRAGLSKLTFEDGQLSAGRAAKELKNNLQSKNDKECQALLKIISDRLSKLKDYSRGAQPKQAVNPMFSKYIPGMKYGVHIDNPVIQLSPTQILRTDMSMTLFLSDPESYDGGALCVDTGLQIQKVKLPAGDAVLYPSTSIHYVEEVTRGERLAMIMWIMSYIRDDEKRYLLKLLADSRTMLSEQDVEGAKKIDLKISQVQANLTRMWVEN